MLVSQIVISEVLPMIYAFVITCLVNQNGGVFHLVTLEKVSNKINHRKENDPDIHLRRVLLGRRSNLYCVSWSCS